MKTEQEKRKQIAKISVFITSVFIIFLSISYAFINQTLTGTKRQVIVAGNLQLELKEGNEITLENMLPMYDEVGMLQKDFTFTLTNKTPEDTKYTIKLKDVTEGSNKLTTDLVKYGLTKDGVVTKDLLSKLKDNKLDSETILGNGTINYSLRLWIDSNVEDETLIKNKSLGYQIVVEATLDTNVAEAGDLISEKLFTEESLGENCKTYDDGTDTFLVGQCNQNYVWYSGKLWRVVLKSNETGAVKMITDNPVTTIAYNEDGNTAFENSYVDQWLSQEFLPTLHNYEDYLVINSTWDTTADDSYAPPRPEGATTTTRTVGLLNAYEYYTTYNKSDELATYETAYLNNGTFWRLITPYNEFSVMYVCSYGLGTTNPGAQYGIRPSINLKSNVEIIAGDGSLTDPYRLRGDAKEIINGTTQLSTRYSGEYINFNNTIYRLIGTESIGEETLTKITAVDVPTDLANVQFHSENGVTNFEEANIKADLENYYQNNIIEPYKSMIAPNITWYLVPIDNNNVGNYKESICKTVDEKISTADCEKTENITTASIGLPRIGEVFASQIARGEKTKFWMLNQDNKYGVWYVDHENQLNKLLWTNEIGARPSMYLKSNVVISKDNTGDGTYEHPYDIELNE